jgi:hypothetical protein
MVPPSKTGYVQVCNSFANKKIKKLISSKKRFITTNIKLNKKLASLLSVIGICFLLNKRLKLIICFIRSTAI